MKNKRGRIYFVNYNTPMLKQFQLPPQATVFNNSNNFKEKWTHQILQQHGNNTFNPIIHHETQWIKQDTMKNHRK